MSEVATAGVAAKPAQPKFGTFLGVFTPSVLTILGVMMYLRFGWVVGNVGLPLGLGIVLLASGITFVTALSASAIATNMRVGVGGEYYMISRSLGLELGGAIGIPLFLCRTLSLTLYCFGLAESVGFLWPGGWGEPPIQLIALAFVAVTTLIAGKSAAASLKLQIPIMIAVGASVLALAGGVLSGGLRSPTMAPTWMDPATRAGGFWFVFAVFFPAVTGFTAGIGMSGDLADPKKSIPRGTMLAVVTGGVLYLAITFLLGISARLPDAKLALLDPEAPPIWTDVAVLGFVLVYPGMWGAILSSAFGSALGGPRVLQALAGDGLVPRFLARTSRTGQPVYATLAAGGIAAAAVLLGDLNAVGRWVTIFFLTLYVTVNLAAALEMLVGDPSYRPTIRVPWYVSLAGSVAAIVVMALINWYVCLAAVALELLLWLYLRRRAMQSRWGDVRAGLWTALARFALLKLRGLSRDARNWRPTILLFTANPSSRMGLVRMANWFNQNRGIVTVCHVVEGDLEDEGLLSPMRREAIDEALSAEGLVAFSEIDVVPEFESGVLTIAQANGIAGLESNTVMFGWPTRREHLVRLLRVMRALRRSEISMILARLNNATGPITRRRIDVWWRGKENNGDLMLLLAYLLRLNAEWREATITVRTIVADEAGRDEMTGSLDELIPAARIQAERDVIVLPPGRTTQEVMHEASREADVVFLGLMTPQLGREAEHAERLEALAAGFNNAIFVRNSGPFRGRLV